MKFAKFFMLTNSKKLQMHLLLKDKEFLNIEKSKEIVKMYLENEYEDIIEIFNKIDLTNVIKGIDTLNKFFECKLIEGNICWISKDSNGHFRYFTRSKTKITYSLDFIDLYSIINNVKKQDLFDMLIKDFKLGSFKTAFVLGEESKIINNLQILNDVILADENVNDILNASIRFYEILCEENKCNLCNSKNFKYKDNSVFFSSLGYLKEKYNIAYSKSIIGKHINLLACLGLVTKVPLSEFDSSISSKTLSFKNKKYNHVSFYSINDINEDIVENLKKIAKTLSNEGIKYYKIDNKCLIEIFGEKFADKIFTQKFKKSQKHFNKEVEKNDCVGVIDLLIRSQIVDLGLASKELIREQVNVSKREFNKIWSIMLKKYSLTEIRPNKKIKEQFNLKKFEPICMLDFINNKSLLESYS